MLSKSPEELERLHKDADERVATFRYEKPGGMSAAKGRVTLAGTSVVRGIVQIVKKDGGENNLHYHTNSDSFWLVLKGRIRFYGPDDVVIGEFGPQEGAVTPAYSRYWFENAGDEDAELLQVSGYHNVAEKGSGRTDITAQRFNIADTEKFEATKV